MNMKVVQNLGLIAMVVVIMLGGISCQWRHSAGIVTTTGATPHGYAEDTVLPPPAGEYEVVGVMEGLKKFVVKYDDTLYRGGEPFAECAIESLRKLGIRTIISITPTDYERAFCQTQNITLVEIPFDKKPGPSKQDLKRYLDTIETGAGPFYLHCHGGTHRGGTLGVAYRIHFLGWSFQEALIEHGRLGGDLLGDHTMLEAVREQLEVSGIF